MKELLLGVLLASLGCGALQEGVDPVLTSAGGSTTSDMNGSTGARPSGASTAAESAVSSGGPGATADTNNDTSEGAGTSSSDASSSETGPQGGEHDGAYTGTVSATINVVGIGVAPCNGEAQFAVDELGNQQVVGEAACQATIAELDNYTIDLTAAFLGATAPPDATGEMTFGIPALALQSTAPWSGSFEGDTFSGEFSGAIVVFGYTTNFDGTWTATR